jgi:hypothetical protein
MPMSSSNNSLESVKAQIRSIETPRAEGYNGGDSGSKILNTKDAVYKKSK